MTEIETSRPSSRPVIAAALLGGIAIAVGAYLLLPTGGTAANATLSIHVTGSETLRPLIVACASSFTAQNPKTSITVKGGGSGDGITSLLLGITDLGMTSRPLLQKEVGFARSKGIELNETSIGMDGIALIVHPGTEVDSVSLGQLKGVFSGKTRDWAGLAKQSGPIVVFARAPGSGTSALFVDRVLGPLEPMVAQFQPTNEAIVAEVAATPGAIGFTSLGAVRSVGDKVKILAVKVNDEASAVLPNAAAVSFGQYPLSRSLSLISAGTPIDLSARFLAHCSGSAGREIVTRAGYFSGSGARP
jgi:phosphate transport system substrate-binding protein